MPETALITGQDGSYLAKLLLEKGYIVRGASGAGRSYVPKQFA